MFSRVHTSLRRAVLGHRRLIAFALTAVAVLLGLRTVSPPAPAASMLVASHDLSAGRTVTAGDLMTVRLDPDAVPHGLVRDPTGHVLAGGVRRGEPITDVRLVGRALGAPGLTTVPIRLPDAATAALLRPGDHVDLYATDPSAGGTTSVARDVLVLAVPPKVDDANGVTSALGGRLVVVGVLPEDVAGVMDASVRRFLTVAFRD